LLWHYIQLFLIGFVIKTFLNIFHVHFPIKQFFNVWRTAIFLAHHTSETHTWLICLHLRLNFLRCKVDLSLNFTGHIFEKYFNCINFLIRCLHLSDLFISILFKLLIRNVIFLQIKLKFNEFGLIKFFHHVLVELVNNLFEFIHLVFKVDYSFVKFCQLGNTASVQVL